MHRVALFVPKVAGDVRYLNHALLYLQATLEVSMEDVLVNMVVVCLFIRSVDYLLT
jgi:hypothetical protein